MFSLLKKYLRKNRKKVLVLLLIFAFFYWNILPDRLFKSPVSLVVESEDGKLLAAHIAADEQWRFPINQQVSYKFEQSIIHFEDKRFYYHWGFDLLSILRASWQNLRAGKILSGASTISMQVIRLSRKKKRNFLEKIIEITLATRLEFSYSKKEILALYASNAPFGGNVVGLDAAAWRYFGRSPDKLSWAETAMLAVLPNAPALIHPSKNRQILFKKRNKLLKKLWQEGIVSQENYELAIDEPIPEKPEKFPRIAPHLLDRIYNNLSTENAHSKYKTTLSSKLQKQVNRIVKLHAKQLIGNGINNVAVLVTEVETGQVLAYVGNSKAIGKGNGNEVDIITAARSTGSILKPFMYAGMLTAGEILPNALVADIPTFIDGYTPKNYNLTYDGAIPAKRALARSLNVPAVRMLRSFGVAKLHHLLTKMGMTTLTQAPDYYGLSLILGGCEGSLWEISGIYSSMARTLNNYTKDGGKYRNNSFFAPHFYASKNTETDLEFLEMPPVVSAAAIWLTFESLLEVERPDEENSWRDFSSSQKIAWKTGTSFGFRDAWAIGTTPDYTVAVWVGNADGEGRPQLVGVRTAAPILFDVFDLLPHSEAWFDQPFDDMQYLPTCSKSGYLPSPNCEQIDSIWLPLSAENFSVCPYHKIIHLDFSESWQVNNSCESPESMVHRSWFILPPTMELYYKNKNVDYKSLPPFRPDCQVNTANNKLMEIIYPKHVAQIYIPLEISGKRGKTVFEVAHRNKEITIYWHLDNEFIGETKHFHQLELSPATGKHTLTLIDEDGNQLKKQFEIITK